MLAYPSHLDVTPAHQPEDGRACCSNRSGFSGKYSDNLIVLVDNIDQLDTASSLVVLYGSYVIITADHYM